VQLVYKVLLAHKETLATLVHKVFRVCKAFKVSRETLEILVQWELLEQLDLKGPKESRETQVRLV
jgi:hypothetical protein